jgi:osmotically-inducible protein OsmY
MNQLRFLAAASALVLGGVAVSPVRAQDVQKPNPQVTNTNQPPDEVIETRAKIRLARSASLMGSDINVDANNGTLTLNGHVLNTVQQDRAKQLVKGMSGVKDVKDNLKVDPQFRMQAMDEKAAGADTGAVKAGDTDEDAEAVAPGAHATISDDQLARMVAQRAARAFPGAKADKEWLFGWDVEGDKWQFDVEVDEGDVILDGSVPSFMDIGKAVDAARKTAGVRSVDASDLRVDDDFLATEKYRDWLDRQYDEIKSDVKEGAEDVKDAVDRETEKVKDETNK